MVINYTCIGIVQRRNYWRQREMWWTYSFCFVACITITYGQPRYNTVEAIGSFNDYCPKGFRYRENGRCIDIDECLELAPCKVNQQCRNLQGGFRCLCPRGFQIDVTGNCVDIDECQLGYCGSGAQCRNTNGSFTCQCPTGHVKRGRFCRDINECKSSPCDKVMQSCINTRGSYRCRCKPGYQDNGYGGCVDSNECSLGMCKGTGEECRNIVGGYECVCSAGYTKDPLTNGRYCVDVNECDLDQCPTHSECINTQGSFYCRCHRGFTKHNGICVDNQECSLGEGSKCQWRCLNTPGSFTCQCPDGYNRVDYACNDINECDNEKHVCRKHETCVNTHGGHQCVPSLMCPNSVYYRKLMTTDEFGYRQITTNICRRKSCRRLTQNNMTYKECKQHPLSVSYHFVEITSGLKTPTNLVRMAFPARRKRQEYNFVIAHGDQTLFSLKQYSQYRPHAYLVLNRPLEGPAEYVVEVEMSTYNKRREMRDNRMLTITVIVSKYSF